MSWWPEGARALRGEALQSEDGDAGSAVALVFVGFVLAGIGVGAAVARRRMTVYTTVQPAGSPKWVPSEKAPPAEKTADLRGWLKANKTVVKPSWMRDVEIFVAQYDEMEQQVAQKDAKNQELQERVDMLEATIRKFPQTPMTSASFTTMGAGTPPTSDTTDTLTPRPDDSTLDSFSRPRSAETQDNPEPLGPVVPTLRFLPPVPAEPPCSESPRFIRPHPKQAVAEATGTFTPLFDERGLSTPRTLMELVSSHRLTKESLQQRINRRTQQAGMQQDQLESCLLTLPEERERADAAIAALEQLLRARPGAERDAAVAALLAFHGARLPALTQEVAQSRAQADEWLAYAYRVQTRLDREMDIGRLESVKHPAGVLMKPSGSPPPVALGALSLPPQKDLSCLAVNPYKVDSWPIEPNSRGGRASGDLCIPPLREEEEEDEDPDEEDWSDGEADADVRLVDQPESTLEEGPRPSVRMVDVEGSPQSPAPAPTDLPAALPEDSPPREEGSPSLNPKAVRLPPLQLGGGGGGTAIA